MNPQKYREQLLTLEREIAGRLSRTRETVRDRGDESAGDSADGSVVDELRDEQLGAAELERNRLTEVRAALRRIDEGTFGACEIDGEPIEEARLNAAPWARYCVRHQEQLEADSTKRATL